MAANLLPNGNMTARCDKFPKYLVMLKLINCQKTDFKIKYDTIFYLAREEAGLKIYCLMSCFLPHYSYEIYSSLYDFIIQTLKKMDEKQRFIIVFFASKAHQATPWSFIISHYYKLDIRFAYLS